MSRRPLGRNERDATKGYWANGKFYLWTDTQKDIDKAFVNWCQKELPLRQHLLPKSERNNLPTDQ